MARWMGFQTIAEGVEKKEEVDFLDSIGCDLIQGYYFAKPMPSVEFKEYLLNHNRGLKCDIKNDDRSMILNTGKKYSILVIDDARFNREVVRDLLSDKYNVVLATNGLEGMQVIEQGKEDIALIILDLMMPVMDGFQFLTKYAQMETAKKVPVIAMSESGNKSEALALSLGAEDFIAKPFSPEIMMLRINKAFLHIVHENK